MSASLKLVLANRMQVISAVPNAVGAICLNQAGIDDTKRRGTVVTNLLETIIATDFESVYDSGKAAHALGSGVDELIRHHPPLRTIVLDGIFKILKQASENGDAFEPTSDIEGEYRLKFSLSAPGTKDKEVARRRPSPTNPPLSALARIFQVDCLPEMK